MYCIKCGVKLSEGTKACPLCHTPVVLPETGLTQIYSTRTPNTTVTSTIPEALILLVIEILSGFTCFAICRETMGCMAWSSYVILSLTVFYIFVGLPLWFRHPNPVIFVGADFVAVALGLLIICLLTGGNWYWCFGLPVVAMAALVGSTIAAIMRYVRKGHLYLFGGVFLTISALCFVIDLLAHITFHTAMFRWSVYTSGPCFLLGIFLMLIAIIKPLKNAMKRFFYL